MGVNTRSGSRLAFESKWAGLRLTEPRSDAPYPVSPSQIQLYRKLTLIPYYLLVLPYMVYWSLEWLLTPGYPGWTYMFMLNTQKGKLYSWLNSWCLQPLEREEDRWGKSTCVPDAMRELYQGAVDRGEIRMETIKLYPVPKEVQIGSGKGDWVKESVIPGCWLSPKGSKGKGEQKAKEGEQVILHIHGGGYISGSPYWNNLALTIAKRTKVRIFSVNYRKPLVPEQAFPAPLLDALSGYLHLTSDLGFPASSITILCKSAGGHLALMLSRYLSDLGLPHPGAFCSMAPWCDFRLESPSYTYNLKFDFLSRNNLLLAASAATRYYKPEATNEVYFNPVLATPADWMYLKKAGVKVYMMVGTKELFEHEVRSTAEVMEAAGVNVTFREDVNGLHTSPLWTPGPMKVFADDVAEVMGIQ